MAEIDFDKERKRDSVGSKSHKAASIHKIKNLSGQTFSSFKVEIDKDQCKGCGLCILYCPFNCLELSSDLNVRGIKYVKKKKNVDCKGCGRCYLICPDSCVEIYKVLSTHSSQDTNKDISCK